MCIHNVLFVGCFLLSVVSLVSLFRLLWFVYYALTCSIADTGGLVKGVGIVYKGVVIG